MDAVFITLQGKFNDSLVETLTKLTSLVDTATTKIMKLEARVAELERNAHGNKDGDESESTRSVPKVD
jgi:hypothetical protein